MSSRRPFGLRSSLTLSLALNASVKSINRYKNNTGVSHLQEMEQLSFITCAACLLFLTGQCSCFQQAGGARFTGSCQSCKCVVVWYLTNKKKQSRKTLFHLNENRSCNCHLPCLVNNKRCSSQGKLALHINCRKLWTPCEHMRKVTYQLAEYTRAAANGNPKVPKGCIPLIGYAKKPSTLLDINFNGRNFLEERRIALKTYKKTYQIKWYQGKNKKKPNKTESQQIRNEKKTIPTESRHIRLLQIKPAEDVLNSTMSQYFSIINKIEKSPNEKVSVFKDNM